MPAEFNAMLNFALRNGFSYFLGSLKTAKSNGDEYEKRTRRSIILRLIRKKRFC